MVKCTKGQIRRLKAALRWKIPAEQRRVAARERDDVAFVCRGNGRVGAR